MLRARIPDNAASTPRRAAVHGVATALLVAAVGFDLAFVATGSRSGLAIAFGLGLLVPMVVLVPVTFWTTSSLERLRASVLKPRELDEPTGSVQPSEPAVVVPVQEPAPPYTEPLLAPWLLDLGGALVRVRHELDVHARRLDTAIRERRLWGLGEQAPRDEAWQSVREVVSRADVGGLVLHDALADAYAEIGRCARVNALRLLTGASPAVVHADRLPDALDAVEWALDRLDLVIGVVAQEAIPAATAERPEVDVQEPALERPAAVIDLTGDDVVLLDLEPGRVGVPSHDPVSS